MPNRCNFSIIAVIWGFLATILGAAPTDYFAIHVVDDATGRGVPLAYLRTMYKTTYVTDSNGYVAFLEPGLMDGVDVWFHVNSYGYQTPPAAFGTDGLRLHVKAGESGEIRIKREQIAERLYRITGYGIDRDSRLLGKLDPTMPPPMSHFVMGQDSVLATPYRGKMFWVWGDTDRLDFPLGNFHSTAAWSNGPDQIDPDHHFNLDYIADPSNGRTQPMVDIPNQQQHPIWLDGLTAVDDAQHRPRLIARYAIIGQKMKSTEEGLVLFNDEREVFEKLRVFDDPGSRSAGPSGHAIRFREGNDSYVFWPNGVRSKADFEHVSNPATYESFTCLDAGGEPTRDASGKLTWRWRAGAEPISQSRSAELVAAGKIKPSESPFQFLDIDSGKPINLASGSIAWNDFLKRWTYLFGQAGGDSNLGEIWFATADSPLGPWKEARKIATHAMKQNNNDFYNPIQHDEFAREGGRYIYFEGTFVNTFSGNPWPTPYYDYNNLMYRIDLADPRMKLPEPPTGLINVLPN